MEWPRPTLRSILRDIPIAILLGMAIGFLIWWGNTSRSMELMLVFCGWIGIWIYAVVTLLMSVFCTPLGRIGGWRQIVGLSALMFVGAGFGYELALVTQKILFGFMSWISPGEWAHVEIRGSGSSGFAFVGGLGIVCGLLFFRYEFLRLRLEQSMARIAAQEHAEKELETARDIQRRILGPSEVDGRGYRVAARNLPARYVAGDFFDVFHLQDGGLGLVVADVSGKGMGASLVMASVKGRLPLLAADRTPSETLAELNSTLTQELDQRQFVALCFAAFDPADGTFELANAGLPDPYVLASGSPPRALVVPGERLPLGMKEGVSYSTLRGELAPDQQLFLLTDGLPEAVTEEGEPLGYQKLEELLDPNTAEPGPWLDGLYERVKNLTGATLQDDWTAMLLTRQEM